MKTAKDLVKEWEKESGKTLTSDRCLTYIEWLEKKIIASQSSDKEEREPLSESAIKGKAIDFADSKERGGCSFHMGLFIGYENGFIDGLKEYSNFSPPKESEGKELSEMYNNPDFDNWLVENKWHIPFNSKEAYNLSTRNTKKIIELYLIFLTNQPEVR